MTSTKPAEEGPTLEENSSHNAEQTILHRQQLSTVDVASLTINKMIGAGIYTVPDIILVFTQPKQLNTRAPLTWIIHAFYSAFELLVRICIGPPYRRAELTHVNYTYKQRVLQQAVTYASYILTFHLTANNAVYFVQYALIYGMDKRWDDCYMDTTFVRFWAMNLVTLICVLLWLFSEACLIASNFLATCKLTLLLLFRFCGMTAKLESVFDRGFTLHSRVIQRFLDKNDSDTTGKLALCMFFIFHVILSFLLIYCGYRTLESGEHPRSEARKRRVRRDSGLYSGVATAVLIVCTAYAIPFFGFSMSVANEEDLMAQARGDFGDMSIATAQVLPHDRFRVSRISIAQVLRHGSKDLLRFFTALSGLGSLVAVAYTNTNTMVELPTALCSFFPGFKVFNSDYSARFPGYALLLHWILSCLWILSVPFGEDGYEDLSTYYPPPDFLERDLISFDFDPFTSKWCSKKGQALWKPRIASSTFENGIRLLILGFFVGLLGPWLGENNLHEPCSNVKQMIDSKARIVTIGYKSGEDGEQHTVQRDYSDKAEDKVTRADLWSNGLSQRLPHQSQAFLLSEEAIACYLVNDIEFTTICATLLTQVSQRTFNHVLVRTLGKFFVVLRSATESSLELNSIRALLARRARERIADEVSKHLEISQPNKSAIQTRMVDVNWVDDTASDSNSDLSNVKSAPVYTQLREFFFTGRTLRSFIVQVKAVTLSRSDPLFKTLMSISNREIQLYWVFEQSLADRFKNFVEGLSGIKWDWWPLSPSHEMLQSGQVRLFWRCHCGSRLWQDVSSGQARLYKQFLEERTSLSRTTDDVCGEITSNSEVLATHHVGLSQVLPKFMRRRRNSDKASWEETVLAMDRPNNDQKPFEATENGQSGGHDNQTSSSHTDLGQRSSTSSHVHKQAQKLMGSGQAHLASEEDSISQGIHMENATSAYVILGAHCSRLKFDVDHIETKDILYDGEFFRKLKSTHRKLRSFWRHHLSIWRMSYCDFVKFEMDDQDSVFPRCNGLPEDHDKDYEFKPRPPKDDPPLTRHQFEVALSTCAQPCRLPLWHTCRTLRRKLAVQRIPKKLSAWEIKKVIDEPDYAWGLQAQYRPVFLMVLLYNGIILAGPFAFWAWWQRTVNPLDLQDASVPAVIALCLLGMFYTLSDIIEPSRSGQRL